VIHLSLGAEQDLIERAQAALAAFAISSGYLRGSLSRTLDDPDDVNCDWVLVTEWRNVGSYRRALGAPAVKMSLPRVVSASADEPTSFEQLMTVDPGGEVHHYESDRA
jgi:heme oxygenase (mycobilin-producing)